MYSVSAQMNADGAGGTANAVEPKRIGGTSFISVTNDKKIVDEKWRIWKIKM